MNRRELLVRSLGLFGITTVPFPATDQIESVPLLLSPEEAQALANIVGLVGGDNRKSQRRYIDSISGRLHYAGYRNQNWNTVSGSIHFTDQDQVKDWRDGKTIIFPRGPDLAFQARWRKSFNPDGSLRRMSHALVP